MENHKQKIEEMINGAGVFIFMKGTPSSPMCRFSAGAMNLLKKHGVENPGYFNVLEDEAMRQAIKDYSNWPTLPQIFVNGQFVGGADILQELEEEGELGEVLGRS